MLSAFDTVDVWLGAAVAVGAVVASFILGAAGNLFAPRWDRGARHHRATGTALDDLIPQGETAVAAKVDIERSLAGAHRVLSAMQSRRSRGFSVEERIHAVATLRRSVPGLLSRMASRPE